METEKLQTQTDYNRERSLSKDLTVRMSLITCSQCCLKEALIAYIVTLKTENIIMSKQMIRDIMTS